MERDEKRVILVILPDASRNVSPLNRLHQNKADLQRYSLDKQRRNDDKLAA
ncbi:hypothetical protein BN439_0123 [Erwinia amylovora Ea644]|nr:hypothetical protein BN439_0123 [Erwinia amylovora Ea644]CCP05213.1 hypothetical protein BN440_0148 [Erwinia amylovora MR1]